jgi:hypothetical protein
MKIANSHFVPSLRHEPKQIIIEGSGFKFKVVGIY